MNASFWRVFERRVRQQPDLPALILDLDAEGPTQLSYRELWLKALYLGQKLQEQGVQAGEIVALDLPRSQAYVASLLACWAVGAVWMPIVGLPLARKQQLLSDAQCQLRLVLSDPNEALERVEPDSTSAEQAAEPFAGLSLDVGALLEALKTPRYVPPRLPFSPQADDPAYLIYTSGTSGTPKGVLVPHGGLVTMLQAQIELLGLGPGDRSLWCLSPLFDASVSDLGTALLSGAALVIAHDPLQDLQRLCRLIEQHGVSYADLPPAILNLLQPEQIPRSLKSILIGGEAPPVEAVRRWSRALKLINVYGPTEATVCTSMMQCSPDWETPLLGEPLPGVDYRCVEGELWIHSPGLALGYYAQPALTAERFVWHEQKRWFRSGDRVEATERGYRFLGRLDRQFKHHGKLICPEEIERELKALSPADQGALAVVPHANGQIIAWSERPLAPGVIDKLKTRLPTWMHPQRYLSPVHWPLTRTGKSDLKALRNHPLSENAHSPAEATFQATTELEARLAELWQEILKLDPLPPEPHFFALGGASLDVLTLVARAAEHHLILSPETVYRHPRLGDLARWLQEERALRNAAEASASHLLKQLPPRAESKAWLPQSPLWQTLDARQEIQLLLTGSTGFLGSRLLAEMLQKTSWTLHCLVRATSAEAAQQRVRKALQKWDLPPQISSQLSTRLRLWPGDLTQAQLGLSSSQWRSLQTEIEAVIHCAAQVDLVRNFEQLAPVNLAPLPRLYALGRPLHLISTLSVLVSAEPCPAVARESDLLDAQHRIWGGYAQSKWAAEKWLLRQAQHDGRPVWIYRPGLITADSQRAVAPQQDWLSALVEGMIGLQGLPELPEAFLKEYPLAVDMTPVDYAARALVALFGRSTAPQDSRIYHLANPQALKIQTLWQILHHNHALPYLELQDWRSREHTVQQHSFLSSARRLALWPLLQYATENSMSQAQSHWHALNIFQATGITLASPQTVSWLNTQGVHCPTPEAALTALLQSLKGKEAQ